MYDPNFVITGKIHALLLLVDQSHLAVNSTEVTFKKYTKISILIRQKKLMLQSSCRAMMSPLHRLVTVSRSGPEGFRKIILGGNLINSLTTT